MKKLLTKISLIVLLAANGFSAMPAGAIGVTVTLYNNTGTTPSQDVGVQWSRSAATTYVTNTTITVTITPVLNSVSSTSALDLDRDGAAETVFTSSSTCSGNACTTITYTVTSTTDSATGFTATTTLYFSSTAANYSVSVLTSSPVDFGAALFYANGGNLVSVSATVNPTLAFSIRTSDDSSTTNSCSLGTLSSAAVSLCRYRLRIATNAQGGFSATIQANQDFGNGTNATMTNITDNGTFATGTEAYGILSLVGATEGGRNISTGVFDQPVTETGVENAGFTFSTDASPVPTSSALTILSYTDGFRADAAPSTTSTSLVTHAAAIGVGTPASSYSQTITYLVTASY